MEERCYYVYEHIRLDNMSTFYVGKGKNNRAYDLKRNDHHDKVADKYGCVVSIIKDGLTEKEALDLGKEIIDDYVFNLGYSINIEGFKRRNDNEYLTNSTWGGDGISGIKFSKERREKISLANKKAGKFKGKNNPMYGKKGKESLVSKSVVMLDSKGTFLKKFDSISEATAYIGKERSSLISRVCRQNKGSAYGYLWLFYDYYSILVNENKLETWITSLKNKSKKDKTLILKHKSKTVLQLNKNTLEIINEYKSITDAHKNTGVLSTSIHRNCRHGSNSAGGYSWIFKDEYLILNKYKLKQLYTYKYKRPFKYHWKNKKRKIICTTTGIVFDGVIDAIKYYNLCKGAKISSVCKGIRKSAGKHPLTNEPLKWKYYDEYIENDKIAS